MLLLGTLSPGREVLSLNFNILLMPTPNIAATARGSAIALPVYLYRHSKNAFLICTDTMHNIAALL